jgi:hypothetical protein
MSASSDLQLAIEQLLAAPNALRVAVPVVKRRTKEIGAEIEAAAANHGLCIYVMAPLPMQVTEGAAVVFIEAAEIRVRIVEQPALNTTGADAYDLVDDVMTGLHWQPFAPILAHPLQLATKPAEMVEDPRTRIIDVIFHATYQLNQTTL